jgi:exopolysaccharide biosynthesis polyprenyl glycosylphosphotransferase
MLERLAYRISRGVLAFDILITLLCLYIASRIRLRIDLGKDVTATQTQVPWFIYLVVALIWLTLFLIMEPHRRLATAGLMEAVGRLVATVGLASLTFAGVLYLSLRDVSRLQFLYFAALNLSALVLFHLAVRLYSQARSPRGGLRSALVVGDPLTAERLAEEFARRPWTGVRVVGYASDNRDAPSGVERLCSIAEMPQLVAEQHIDEVIFALPPQQHDRVAKLSLTLLEQPVMVHMIPGLLDLTFARTSVEMFGGVPLISLRESALTQPQRILKRAFDLLSSAGLLLLLSPLMLLIAALIKIESPGPVFFLQERIGEQGRRFKMIKFRTMTADAEGRWREVARRDEEGRLVHKSEDDPRITALGRRLRRASFDELPQLINVLRGEMSLVGPRPEIPHVAAEYEPWQWHRFRVPPGMTGWWQVNGRSDRPMHLHTEDDLFYIQNYSFWLDVRILFKTVAVVLNGDGAY